LALDEELTKRLLKLDSISSGRLQDIRERRKALVHTINSYLLRVEPLKNYFIKYVHELEAKELKAKELEKTKSEENLTEMIVEPSSVELVSDEVVEEMEQSETEMEKNLPQLKELCKDCIQKQLKEQKEIIIKQNEKISLLEKEMNNLRRQS